MISFIVYVMMLTHHKNIVKQRMENIGTISVWTNHQVRDVEKYAMMAQLNCLKWWSIIFVIESFTYMLIYKSLLG